MTIVDLSLPIRPHVRWKTEVTVQSNFEDPSHPFRSSRLAMPGHGFTHCDGFSHFLPAGTTVDRMPLETWIGDAAVVDLTHVGANTAVEAADFEVQGVLTVDDPFDPTRPNCHHVVHGFPMKAGKSYTIDCISTNVFDNFLRLEDESGRQLAMDDDSGGNLNARIANFQPPRDGWYRIIVTTFAPNAAGAYTLKVR